MPSQPRATPRRHRASRASAEITFEMSAERRCAERADMPPPKMPSCATPIRGRDDAAAAADDADAEMPSRAIVCRHALFTSFVTSHAMSRHRPIYHVCLSLAHFTISFHHYRRHSPFATTIAHHRFAERYAAEATRRPSCAADAQRAPPSRDAPPPPRITLISLMPPRCRARYAEMSAAADERRADAPRRR